MKKMSITMLFKGMTFRSPFVFNFYFLYTFNMIKVISLERETLSNELTRGKADQNDCEGGVPISNHTTEIREQLSNRPRADNYSNCMLKLDVKAGTFTARLISIGSF